MKDMTKLGLTLLIICVVASLCLSLVYSVTKPQIQKQQQLEESESFRNVAPEAKDFNPVTKNNEILYYEAKNSNGETIAYVFKASRKGYSSVIDVVAGMTKEGKITNITIVNQNETPGLGSRICEVDQPITLWDKIRAKKAAPRVSKPWFQARFSNVDVEQIDEVDAITGATISSEAVKKAVQEKAREVLKEISSQNKD